MGSLSSQVKQRRKATSLKTIPDIIDLSVKNAWNQEEHPRAQKNNMEALSIHYEPTFSVWSLTDHVIYSQI
jgi:hypothetical protein